MDVDDAARLRRAIVRLARQFNTSATDESLTPTQASVLALVVGRGPVGIPELARVEHINPTMLSRVLGRLEEEGLATRSPDPDDQRSVTVSATPKGRQVNTRIKARRARDVQQASDQLPRREQQALLAALDGLEGLADQLGR